MSTFRKHFFAIAGLATLLVAGAGCATAEAPDDGGAEEAITAGAGGDAELTLAPAAREALVEQKATCPFLGAAIWTRNLVVRGVAANPLARIADVAALGDAGGGDLGSVVLATFAKGNHGRMHGVARDASGHAKRGPNGEVLLSPKLEVKTAETLFSLDLPPSQGSHPGHSGILEGGPTGAYVGRFDPAQLQRLTARAVDGAGRRPGERGFEGPKFLQRSALGAFVWENVSRDPDSVYLGHGLGGAALADLAALHRSPDVEHLVALSGTDDLVGASGELGLLMTVLEHEAPVGGEPAVALADVEAMFARHELPPDWAARPKRSVKWVTHTMAILAAAERARP